MLSNNKNPIAIDTNTYFGVKGGTHGTRIQKKIQRQNIKF